MLWQIPDAALIGGAFFVDSRTIAESIFFPDNIRVVQTGGYNVAGDNGNANYKRVDSEPTHAGKFQSADGAWWELFGEVINVSAFGAIGDRVTECADAINLAIDYANNIAPNVERLGTQGCTLFFPDGGYIIEKTLDPIKHGRIDIQGASQNGTILLPTFDGVVFSYQKADAPNLVVKGGFSNLSIEYDEDDVGVNSVFCLLENAYTITFQNVGVEMVGTLVQIGTDDFPAGGLMLDNVIGGAANISGAFIEHYQGVGIFINPNCAVFVNGVSNPTIDRVSTMTTAVNRNFINLNRGFMDTLCIYGGIYERWYRGINIFSTAVIQNIFISPGAIFDYFSESIIYSDPGVGGVVSGFFMEGAWLASWSGYGVKMIDKDQHYNINIATCKFPFSGLSAIEVEARYCKINGNTTSASNRINAGKPGISVNGDAIIVTNNIGDLDGTQFGLPWQGTYGIQWFAEIPSLNISSNTCYGVTNNFAPPFDVTSSLNRKVYNNNRANYAALSAVPLEPSGSDWTNTTGFYIEVYLVGGTVTQTRKNGIPLNGGGLQGYLCLAPGESFGCTYTVAPTITSFVKA